MRQSIVLKLWAALLGLVLAVLLPLGVAIHLVFSQFYLHQQAQRLLSHGTLLADMLGHSPMATMMLPMVAEMVEARVALLDTTGAVVAQAGLLPAVGPPLLTPAQWQHVLGGSPLTLTRASYAGEPHQLVAVPIPSGTRGLRGALVLLAPLRPVEAALQRVRALLLLAGVGALLLSVGLAFLLSLALSRRLIAMERVTRAIVQGDLTARVPATAGDEVGRLAGAINELASHLQRYEQNRQEFLASVSHELRTPLAYLRGYSQALADGLVTSPEEQSRYHRILLDESLRLSRLVDDLMDLAQMQAGRLALAREPTDLREVIGRALAKVEPKAKAEQVAIRTEIPAELPPVWADPGRTEQVLLNLLDNALRHTPSGGTIAVAAESDRSQIRISVTDTGSGIAPDELPHIWERFYTADKSRARGRSGHGLGLAIVRSIVTAHGGNVGVESRPGEGSTFWFTLPRHQPSSQRQAGQAGR